MEGVGEGQNETFAGCRSTRHQVRGSHSRLTCAGEPLLHKASSCICCPTGCHSPQPGRPLVQASSKERKPSVSVSRLRGVVRWRGGNGAGGLGKKKDSDVDGQTGPDRAGSQMRAEVSGLSGLS